MATLEVVAHRQLVVDRESSPAHLWPKFVYDLIVVFSRNETEAMEWTSLAGRGCLMGPERPRAARGRQATSTMPCLQSKLDLARCPKELGVHRTSGPDGVEVEDVSGSGQAASKCRRPNSSLLERFELEPMA